MSARRTQFPPLGARSTAALGVLVLAGNPLAVTTTPATTPRGRRVAGIAASQDRHNARAGHA
ncbi:hypothetical protein HMPREF0591_0536 [Mycobacterium parascrofulaceum ATCC BAA-614]|uniref:Uncharacterized protein n=1 Tax=Mycobacterium parascrofulaceum ATCC BAA-614 TaxID=525368 RepID=D5P2Z2_9MYCO|nr:hypothetical protein HMPREF0591_0536 [Mycobacterium parascrofulaceum ATCC BAA-614]